MVIIVRRLVAMDEVIEYKSNGHLFYYLILEDKSPNFLKNLRDNSINLVITSPPYNE